MPKKFKGENSKAVEAKARKESKRLEEVEKKQKQLEDEFWQDDDKHAARKQQRKGDKEKKRLEQLERKKEAERLLDEEMSSIKSAKPTPSKLTRAEIEANQEREAAAEAAEAKQKATPHDELPLEENINRLEIDGDEARDVEEAIAVLSVTETALEKHPEKRMKAAFTAYEAVQLPILKQENPNLRLSQLKQILKKDWMKSPQNPLNQRAMAYNDKFHSKEM